MPDIYKFKDQFALIVGDIMVDKYIIGDVERISPEAPVPVLLQRKTERKVGGCGNVAMNVVALGARARVVSAVGNDSEGKWLVKALGDVKINDDYLFAVESIPTVTKTRVVSKNQQFIRIDDEDIHHVPQNLSDRINMGLNNIFDGITVVILSDYAKGFLTKNVCRIIIDESKKRGIPIIVDPKGKDCSKYQGATIITPNTSEFVIFTGKDASKEDQIVDMGTELCEKYNFEHLLLTRSEKGISILDQTGKKLDFPTDAKEVIDVTGAGDTVVSVVALSCACGLAVEEGAVLANKAASIVISKFGVAQASFHELLSVLNTGDIPQKYDSLETIKELRTQGKRVVFTNGCFDIVHAGHISSFKQARNFGDVLVVGLNSDASVKRLKGDFRPIVNLKHRKELLEAICYVDFVIPFEEDTPERLIQSICPDVLVKGLDWKGKEVAGSEHILQSGGRVEFIELEQGLSTTTIVERIKRMVSVLG